MSYLIANPEDRFSHDKAQMLVVHLFVLQKHHIEAVCHKIIMNNTV